MYRMFALLLLVVVLDGIHSGQDCLSCNNIANLDSCQHVYTCNDDEVCYRHKFRSESGAVSYDLGCGYKQTCSYLLGSIIGKRQEGRHHISSSCCNNTRLCNRGLQSSTPMKNNSHLPEECADIPNVSSGIHYIYPNGSLPAFAVYCHVSESKAWTVIQKRTNGCVNFYRSWQDYKVGFGDVSTEYWLGNEHIHLLTSHGRHALKIELADFTGKHKYANYSSFSVGNEGSGYQILVSGYNGTAGDSLVQHNGMKFSTFDKDNDSIQTANCASYYSGAWWYYSCYYSNLNGKYLGGNVSSSTAKGMTWNSWMGGDYSLKSSTMMIRKY